MNYERENGTSFVYTELVIFLHCYDHGNVDYKRHCCDDKTRSEDSELCDISSMWPEIKIIEP